MKVPSLMVSLGMSSGPTSIGQRPVSMSSRPACVWERPGSVREWPGRVGPGGSGGQGRGEGQGEDQQKHLQSPVSIYYATSQPLTSNSSTDFILIFLR